MSITSTSPTIARITALAHDGRGIARPHGKTTFIEGALTGEQVRFVYCKRRNAFDEAETIEILEPAPDRTKPRCPHFGGGGSLGRCNGCDLQHLTLTKQRQFKETVFLEQMRRIAGMTPAYLMPPVTGPAWGYRRRARLSVKYVPKKGKVLVGFREKNGRYVAQIAGCETLVPELATLISPLQSLIGQLKAREHIPQIEAAAGDTQRALILRHLVSLPASDRDQLTRFAQDYNLWLYLQPDGPASIRRLWPDPSDATASTHLSYWLPEDGIKLQFEPWDFIQVNADINRRMVSQAREWLAPSKEIRVLELFCGLGNFTLSLARYCQSVVAVEGSCELVRQAQRNAEHNKINNVQFQVADLTEAWLEADWALRTYDGVLLDPPRSGAREVVQQMSRWQPKRLVYVSCNPATLARDASALANQGYHLVQAGLLDMFPHTHHSEWMGLFVRNGRK